MTGSVFPTQRLLDVAQLMYDFEAPPSRRNTGTGSRREGEKFEELVGDLWDALADYAASGHRSLGRGFKAHRTAVGPGSMLTEGHSTCPRVRLPPGPCPAQTPAGST